MGLEARRDQISTQSSDEELTLEDSDWARLAMRIKGARFKVAGLQRRCNQMHTLYP